MNCRLVSVSKPSADTDCRTAEELIAYCARVSNPNNQNNNETASKLVSYLVKNSHFSPLEMVHVNIEINTTRDIARQILRHRSFSFQEFSQRYAKVEDMEFVTRECRLQDNKNRQNSIEGVDPKLAEEWNMVQQVALSEALRAYEWALEKGIAKEQARVVLPEGLTPSRMYMAGSMRSWLHYCLLRMGNGTQKEHRIIAQECWAILGTHFPNIVKIFDENKETASSILSEANK